MAISTSQRSATHSKLKVNPYKNAALAMSKAVADDGILGRVGELRKAKTKAGEAPPEPMSSQDKLTHEVGLEHTLDSTGDHELGSESDLTEQAEDKGGEAALGHHKHSIKASAKELIAEAAETGEDDGDDDDAPGGLSAVDRIARSFSSPRKAKRTVNVGAPSKSDFGSLHARAMSRARGKE